MTKSLRDTIKASMADVLTHGGLIFGQNLTDVGWVAGTLPEDPTNPGYVELPIADVAGPGLAVGAALSGRRVVYIVRYSGYLWFNMAPIATYAATSGPLFGQDCPILVRVLSDDGPLGPIAGGSFDGLALQGLGLRVFSPVTPTDWADVWHSWTSTSEPCVVLEYRPHFELNDSTLELEDNPNVVFFSIGSTYRPLMEAKSALSEVGIRVALFRVNHLNPFAAPVESLWLLRDGMKVLVADPGSQFGAASTVVAELLKHFDVAPRTISTRSQFPGYAQSVMSRPLDAQTVVQMVAAWVSSNEQSSEPLR